MARIIKRIVQIAILFIVCLSLYHGSMYLVEHMYRDMDGEESQADCIIETVMDHEWPQWQGPERNQRSAETGLLKSWEASTAL